MIFFYIMAGLGAALAYNAALVSEGKVYREQVLGTYRSPRERLKAFVAALINKVILTENVVKKLKIVKGSKKTYVSRFLMSAGVAILLAVETQSLGLLLFGAVFAWAYPTVSLSRKVKRWHEDILLEIPTLVRMLKIRFAISDTVTNAVVNVRDSLSGPLGEEWLLMVSEVENQIPLDTALDNLTKRADVRELVSVCSRLKSYYRMGLPEAPFGDMDNTLIQIQAIQRRAQIKRMTTPLMFFTGIGFLTLVIPILVVVLINMFHSIMFSF